MKHIQHLLVPKFYLALAIIWTGIVSYFCLVNSKSIPTVAKGFDKIGHFSFHFGMVFFWFLYLNAKNQTSKLKVNIRNAFLVSFNFGVLIEICQQYFTTTRTADIKDVYANSVGGFCCSIFLFLLFKNYFSKKEY